MLTPYQQYIHKSRYARYIQGEGRRETWEETVGRYIDYFAGKFPGTTTIDFEELRQAILNLEIMPSMRALMTAGPALEKDNVAGYNCAYTPIDHPRVLDEIMYILMCGTGVGFSVERQYVNKMPQVPEEFYNVDTTITVPDSKIGWASSFRQYISSLYNGLVPKADFSRIRPAGAALATFGGRASGPDPLVDLFRYTERCFRGAAGRKLTSLELHDLVCKIAEVVVCGGVRRSALLSLSNLTDERMRHAKDGNWYELFRQRALANNSVAYTETPDMGVFTREWLTLYESKSGERGIFNRASASVHIPERRKNWDPALSNDYGTNPCSEIILRPRQFCNLSEAIIKPSDVLSDIERKVRLATQLGTLQSALTGFRYLSSAWKATTENERLLGVSLSGIMDHPALSRVSDTTRIALRTLKGAAIEENTRVANDLGISPSAAITCVKPSGTVSQLVNCSSGIHPRYAPFYIRRVRADAKDPLCDILRGAGVPVEPSHTSSSELVFSFPMASPEGSRTVDDLEAIEQLEHWLMYAEEWCEHKPSVSIYVREHEWLDVAAWVYKHFDRMTGVSFFPYDDHVYRQAPYEKITGDEWASLASKFPVTIDFDVKEGEDATTASQEYACVGGKCEL